jgi:hypothetical protein
MEVDGQGHVAPERASTVPKQHPCSFTSLGSQKEVSLPELTFRLHPHHTALTFAPREQVREGGRWVSAE